MKETEGLFNDSILSGAGLSFSTDEDEKLISYDSKYRLFRHKYGSGSQLDFARNVDYKKMSEYVFGKESNTNHGHVVSTYLAQSANEKNAYSASSGGFIKEVLYYLFDQRLVDGVLSIKHVDHLNYEPYIYKSKEELVHMPNSIYHVTDYSSMIDSIRESDCHKLVAVGVPWMIDDLYSYCYFVDNDLKNRLVLTIGLLTGWYFNHHHVKALCAYNKIAFDQIKEISYRGGGRIGKIRISLQDGTTREIPRFSFKSKTASERYFSIPSYLTYVNKHNMLADIVVGDAHLKETDYSKIGINLVVCRSQKGEDLTAKVFQEGGVKYLKYDDDTIVKSQRRNNVFGDFAYSYQQYLQNFDICSYKVNSITKSHHLKLDDKELNKFHKKYLRRLKMQSLEQYKRILVVKLLEVLSQRLQELFSGELIKKVKNKFKKGASNDLMEIFD